MDKKTLPCWNAVGRLDIGTESIIDRCEHVTRMYQLFGCSFTKESESAWMGLLLGFRLVFINAFIECCCLHSLDSSLGL